MRRRFSISTSLLIATVLTGAAGPLAAGSPDGLGVSLELTEETAFPGSRRWNAEVTVTCDAGPGACGHVRIEVRYASPGGEPTRVPVADDGLPSTSSPFVVPLAFRDREIVVALFDGTDELRVLKHTGAGSLSPLVQVDLPNRIEALGVGDVDDDGLDEIVIGLDGNDDAHLRVFDYDPDTGTLQQAIVSGVLPEHVEGLTVGDADNDGRNEIVVGLEYGEDVFPRVRLYELEPEGWVERMVSAPGSLHVQDVQVGDVDGDGLNEIVASMSNGGSLGPTQIRLYRHVGGSWVPENATPIYPSRSAERLIVADADGDGDSEIVTAYWTPDFPRGDTMLVVIDEDQGQWGEAVIDTGYVVDGLAVGDLDGDSRPDVFAGENIEPDSRVRGYEWDPGAQQWELTYETAPIGRVWDVDLVDYDDDGANEVLIANDTVLRGLEADGTLLQLDTFPVIIDSALAADVDHDEPRNPRICDLAPTGSCYETFELLSGSGSPAGTWIVTAHASDAAGTLAGTSAAAVAASGDEPGAGGRIPDSTDAAVPPLTVETLPGGAVRLRWSPSCRPEDLDFAVYEGEVGPLTDPVPVTCSTGGLLEWNVSPASADAYFVVVPTNGTTEGSYGRSSSGERVPGASACLPQSLSAPVCP